MYHSKKKELIERLRFIMKQRFGQRVQISLPRQLFNGAFTRKSFVNKELEATSVFYNEVARHILNAAVEGVSELEAGEVFSVTAEDLDELPQEIHARLCLVINDLVDCAQLIYAGERGNDTFVFTKV